MACKKQKSDDGAHHGVSHGGTVNSNSVKANSPCVHFVSLETNKNHDPDSGNILAGGRFKLAVCYVPSYTWTVGNNISEISFLVPFLKQVPTKADQCIISLITKNLICLLLCSEAKASVAFVPLASTGLPGR